MQHYLTIAGLAAGLRKEEIGSHSLRIGGATAMYHAVDDLQRVKRFGRWASDSFHGYLWESHEPMRGISTNMATDVSELTAPPAQAAEGARRAGRSPTPLWPRAALAVTTLAATAGSADGYVLKVSPVESQNLLILVLPVGLGAWAMAAGALLAAVLLSAAWRREQQRGRGGARPAGAAAAAEPASPAQACCVQRWW